MHLNAGLEPGAEHGAASLAQLEGSGRIAGKDELFHRHLVGGIIRHHLGDGVKNEPQPVRPGLVANPDAAAGDAQAVLAVRVDDAEAGVAGARVDAQDAMAQGPAGGPAQDR